MNFNKKYTVVFSSLVLLLSSAPIFAETEIPTKPVNAPTENEVIDNPIIIQQRSINLALYSEMQLNVALNPDAGAEPLKYSSSDASIVSVSSEGRIHALKAGNAVITVSTQVGSQSFTDQITVKVQNQEGKVEFEFNEVFVNRGGSYAPKYTISNPDISADSIIWDSSNPKIASIENGVIQGHQKGEVTITAAIRENVSSMKVRIVVPLEKMVFNADDVKLEINTQKDMPELIFVPYDASLLNKVQYSIANTSIAKLEGQKISGIAKGKTELIASLDGQETRIPLEVIPPQTETGLSIIEFDTLEETNSHLILGLKQVDDIDKPISLHIATDAVDKAISSDKIIEIRLPDKLLKENMKLVDTLIVPKDGLALTKEKPLKIDITTEKKQINTSFSIQSSRTTDLNLKYKLSKIDKQSQFPELAGQRAFLFELPSWTSQDRIEVTFPAKAIESGPGHMNFVYPIENNKIASQKAVDVSVSEEGAITFMLASPRSAITFNKLNRNNDKVVIWTLLATLAAVGVGVGVVLYRKRYKK